VFDNPDPLFPAANPRITTIAAPYTNGPSEYTDGVDVELTGKFDLPWNAGSFSTDLSVTKILSFVYEQPGSPNLQYAGTQSPYNLSSGAGTPQWRGSFTNTWTKGPVQASVLVYYVSGYKMYGEDLFGPPSAGTCLLSIINQIGNIGNCRTGSFTDVDLTGSYNITDHWQVSGAVLNVRDTRPPANLPNYAGINYNPTYSQAGIVGRFFKLGMHYKF